MKKNNATCQQSSNICEYENAMDVSLSIMLGHRAVELCNLGLVLLQAVTHLFSDKVYKDSVREVWMRLCSGATFYMYSMR